MATSKASKGSVNARLLAPVAWGSRLEPGVEGLVRVDTATSPDAAARQEQDRGSCLQGGRRDVCKALSGETISDTVSVRSSFRRNYIRRGVCEQLFQEKLYQTWYAILGLSGETVSTMTLLTQHLLNACTLCSLVTWYAASTSSRAPVHIQSVPMGRQPQAPCPPAPPISDTQKHREGKTLSSYIFFSPFLNTNHGYALGKGKNVNDWRRQNPSPDQEGARSGFQGFLWKE